MKPFRFGVNVMLTVPDHLTDLFAPMPALVSAAEATKRLRVGTNVLNNDLRHPMLVAREAATVDLLTDGRLQLGLGAGHMKPEYDQSGMVFDPGGTRVERRGEAVTIVKGLLQGEPVTFAGRHYRVTDHRIHGLSGITFRRGGAEPDFSGWRAGGVGERVRLVREAAGEAAEELAGRWPQLSPEEILQSPYVLIGTVRELVENLHARRERWGISYYVVFEPFMEALAPVVAALAGR